MKAYDDALALLRSIRAIPETTIPTLKLYKPENSQNLQKTLRPQNSKSPPKPKPAQKPQNSQNPENPKILQKSQKTQKSKSRKRHLENPRTKPHSKSETPVPNNEDLKSLEEKESAVIKDPISGYPMTQVPDTIIQFQ